MRIEKTKTEHKEVTTIIESWIECDLCKKKIELEKGDEFECKFKITEGCGWPEGGSYEIEKADFCRSCSAEIKNLLVEKGVQFYKYDYDY